jgi:hypothetical protein
MLCHHHPMTEPCPAESCRNRENLSCLTLGTLLMWRNFFGSSLNRFGRSIIVLSQSMRDTHSETGLQIDKGLYLALPMWYCELIELPFHTDAVSSRTPLPRVTTNVWLNEGFLPPSGMPTKEPSHIMNFWTPCGWLDVYPWTLAFKQPGLIIRWSVDIYDYQQAKVKQIQHPATNLNLWRRPVQNMIFLENILW